MLILLQVSVSPAQRSLLPFQLWQYILGTLTYVHKDVARALALLLWNLLLLMAFLRLPFQLQVYIAVLLYCVDSLPRMATMWWMASTYYFCLNNDLSSMSTQGFTLSVGLGCSLEVELRLYAQFWIPCMLPWTTWYATTSFIAWSLDSSVALTSALTVNLGSSSMQVYNCNA